MTTTQGGPTMNPDQAERAINKVPPYRTTTIQDRCDHTWEQTFNLHWFRCVNCGVVEQETNT